jgi:hypothetical protein
VSAPGTPVFAACGHAPTPLLKPWYWQNASFGSDVLHLVSFGNHDQFLNGSTAPSMAFRGLGKVIMPVAQHRRPRVS